MYPRISKIMRHVEVFLESWNLKVLVSVVLRTSENIDGIQLMNETYVYIVIH